MGIPLSGGIPLDGGSVANLGNERTYLVKRRSGAGAFTYGPYRAQRAPISGSERLALNVGPIATADERLFFSKGVIIAPSDVVLCLETGMRWVVVYLQSWPDEVVAFIAREGVPLAGNTSEARPA